MSKTKHTESIVSSPQDLKVNEGIVLRIPVENKRGYYLYSYMGTVREGSIGLFIRKFRKSTP